MKSARSLLALPALAVLVALLASGSSAPPLLNYQGRLTTASGQPIAAVVPMHFAILDGDTMTAAVLWGETQSSVSVNQGIYNVILGSVHPVPPSALAGGTVFLEVQVSGETLKPRQRLTSVAYALRASEALNAQNLGGQPSGDYYSKAQVDALITNLQTALQAQLDALQLQTNTNTSDITANTATLAALATQISGLDSRVTVNETDIFGLDSRVTATEANIANHETRLTNLETELASGGGNPENLSFKVDVDPAGPGWKVEVVKPTVFNSTVNYPGVNASRVNNVMVVTATANNADASSLTLTLTLKSASLSPLPRLWLDLHSLEGPVQLATAPDAENGNTLEFADGEPIFVFGPLDPGQSMSLTLNFTRFGLALGYEFTFDVLLIDPRMAYTSYSGSLTNAEVFTSWPDGTHSFQATNAGLYAFYPAYAPGGERIAYAGLGPYYDIYTAHPDGSHLTQVTHGPDSATHPAFSPDGKTLVYDCIGRSADSVEDICLNDVGGGNETVLVNGCESVTALLPKYTCPAWGWYQKKVFLPSWSPDGTKIIFMTRHPEKYGRWYFVVQQMNPATKTPVGNLVILNRPWDLLYSGTSHQWMNLTGAFNWGPDSQHAAFDAVRYNVTTPPGLCFYPSCGSAIATNRRYFANYAGSWIVDLAALMGDPQYGATIGPYLGSYSTAVLNGQLATYSTETKYAAGSLSSDASQITFTQYLGGPVYPIVELPLNSSYHPTSATPQTLISNQGQNGNPAWMPPLLPGFYH